MKKVVVLGAGRSSPVLLHYLNDLATQSAYEIWVGDGHKPQLEQKLANLSKLQAFLLDLNDPDYSKNHISGADVVISMLPASLHIQIAKACLTHKVHLITASYANEEVKELSNDAAGKGLIFLMECGLDPGLDHMSAMVTIDEIRKRGGELIAFETFTGGLLAPDNQLDNPWEYKFTWNPRNVVLSGQGVVKFLQEGRYKFIPYHKLFQRTEVVHIPGYGYFEGYANRDSLKYLDLYNLRGIRTLYRGTFRRVGFCKAWNIFVQLGATDDTYLMEGVAQMTHRQFINSFLSYNPHDSVELKLAHYLNLDLEGPEMYKLKWLGIFDEDPVGLETGSPAQILEHILIKKWTLTPEEKDMVVMWHKFDYLENGEHHQQQSHIVAMGDDTTHTAMAKTVGLPLGIACRLLLEERIEQRGVIIPTHASIYTPVLEELKQFGVEFRSRKMSIQHETTG